jgi:hypothetical protein
VAVKYVSDPSNFTALASINGTKRRPNAHHTANPEIFLHTLLPTVNLDDLTISGKGIAITVPQPRPFTLKLKDFDMPLKKP